MKAHFQLRAFGKMYVITIFINMAHIKNVIHIYFVQMHFLNSQQVLRPVSFQKWKTAFHLYKPSLHHEDRKHQIELTLWHKGVSKKENMVPSFQLAQPSLSRLTFKTWEI